MLQIPACQKKIFILNDHSMCSKNTNEIYILLTECWSNPEHVQKAGYAIA